MVILVRLQIPLARLRLPVTAGRPVGMNVLPVRLRVLAGCAYRIDVDARHRLPDRIRPASSQAMGMIAGRLSQGLVPRALLALMVRQAARRAAESGRPLPHDDSPDRGLALLLCCTRRSIVQVHVGAPTRPTLPRTRTQLR